MKNSILIVAIMLVQLVIGQTPQPVYYHGFNGTTEASGFTVASTGNTLISDLNGDANQALAMASGHGLISLNIQDNKVALMQEGTISLWYKHEGTGTSAFGSNKPLFYWSNGNSSWSEGLMLSISENRKLRFISYKAQNQGVNYESQFTFPYTPSGQWNHFTVVYKFPQTVEDTVVPGHIRIYVNGAMLVNGVLNYALPASTTNSIVFAGFNSSHPSSLFGAMDEIRVYTESLTTEQVGELFANDIDNFSMPEPVIVHEFSNQFHKENFDLGDNTSLVKSRHNTFANALSAPISHTGISVDLEGHKNELAQAGTISFWYNHSGMTQTNIPGYKPLFNVQNANGDGAFMLGCGFNDNANRFQVDANPPGPNNYGAWTEHNSYSFPTNQWHQYTLVYQTGAGGYADFYMDGQKIVRFDAEEFNYTPQDLGRIYFLGKDPSFINYMYGTIDGIRIYDQALSPLQVASLFSVVDQEENYYPLVEYKLDNNTYDTYRVFNALNSNGVYFGDDINGDVNAAAYLNTVAGSPKYLEISKDFNQYLTGGITAGFGFKLLDVSETNFLNNIIVPLFYSSSINYEVNRVSLSVNRTLMKLQLKVLNETQVIDFPVAFNTWYYAHVVIEGDTVKVYVNGELLLTYTSEEALGALSNNRGLFFGRANEYSNQGAWSTLVGAMDEVFVEGRAYDAQEIMSSVQAFDPQGVLSVIDNQPTVGVKAYPNPTQGELNFTDVVDVKIMDIQGRLINELKSVQSLDLSSQKSGIYIIKLDSDQGSKSIKVIKK